MRYREIRELVQLRLPSASRTERVLSRCVTVEDLRREAVRRWPRGARGYIEGGADGEVSLDRNLAAYRAYEFVPRTMRDVSDIDMGCELLGRRVPLPFGLGPTGYTKLAHPDGERAAARAARDAGIPYTLSTMATTRLEDVAQVGGDLWFQLYVWRDRGLSRDLLDRAQAAGYRVLLLAVDVPVTGMRARDLRNGFTLPPRITPGAFLDMARHPAWCLGLLRGEPITFANFAPEVSSQSESVMEFAARQFDPSVTWRDLSWVRERWPGPLVVKGLLDPDDAARAVDAGADAVVVSNHGGRQLDQAQPPIEALPAVRERLGDEVEVLVDSGIRRGSDLAIALARGASGCLVGRPYLYGLGVAGQAGAAAAIDMLTNELRRAMRLLGVTSVAELRAEGASLVRRAG